MTDHVATPVGGRTFTTPVRWLLALVVMLIALLVWRFSVGLGPASGLNDGYPWGLWIAFDVVTGTALACGGYAVAFLVYVLNRGRYHPLVRPAILTSALGYSVAAVGIAVDVGRPWYIWRIPLSPDKWNHSSALLEVALCVMAYVMVLWIELSPAFFEKWRDSRRPQVAAFARRVGSGLDRILVWIVALGLLLPTMHQSSLGTVILLSGPRMHPLWHTAWVPLLFLVSCIAMGYAVVVMESTLSSRLFRRRREDSMLRSLSSVMVVVLSAFVLIRLVDILVQGKAPLLFGSGGLSLLFWFENLLMLAAAVLLMRRPGIDGMFRAAMLIVLAGSLYRFDAYLVAFNPGAEWSYFPTVPEIAITVGLVAVEILAYILIVKRFPILSGEPAASA